MSDDVYDDGFSESSDHHFRGLYECRLDGCRITIPKSFRNIIQGKSNCLLQFIPCIDAGLFAVSLVTPSAETIALNKGVQMDAKGRIRLPTAFVDLLRQEEAQTVILLGAIGSIEIWTPAGWEECVREASKDFP